MFSITRDDPFIVFQSLQEIARAHAGEHEVIDLSRGDPGYGFTPSSRGRRFASYLLLLDSILNAEVHQRLPAGEEKSWRDLEQRIREATEQSFLPMVSASLLQSLREFIDAAQEAALEEGKQWNDLDVYKRLFANARLSGGSYLDPRGEEISRVIVAAWHRRELGMPVTSEDLILTNGASHAIGTIFKALGEEGCGYLQRGDAVLTSSPAYAPYHRILEERGVVPITFTIDPLTGHLTLPVRSQLSAHRSQLKALLLINPHNPTGFSLSESDLHTLADAAEELDLLIISDDVYVSFFPGKETLLKLSPERTLSIHARSKIERSTGLRFGEILVLPEGRHTIAKKLGLGSGEELLKLLIFAKAPSRAGGQFQHTTFVPGPSQLLGMAHIVLGEEERQAFLEHLRRNHEVFIEALSLPHRGNLYYLIFDLDALPGCTTQHLPMEERLTRLAEAGVIYLPAYRFFSKEERKHPGAVTSVRASVVNTSAEKLLEAARRTKAILCPQRRAVHSSVL